MQRSSRYRIADRWLDDPLSLMVVRFTESIPLIECINNTFKSLTISHGAIRNPCDIEQFSEKDFVNQMLFD